MCALSPPGYFIRKAAVRFSTPHVTFVGATGEKPKAFGQFTVGAASAHSAAACAICPPSHQRHTFVHEPSVPTNALRSVFTSCLRSRSEEHTSELQSLRHLVCRLLLEKKKTLLTH